jgi:translation initiation factor 2B subunit (eIF-2B alpha/beta/delta family)
MRNSEKEPREIRKLRERLEKLRSRIYYIDVQTLGDHVTSTTLDFLHKLRPKNRENLALVLSRISDIIRAYFPFSFPALFVSDIISIAARHAEEREPKEVKERLQYALRLLLTRFSRSLNELSVNISRYLDVGSEVLVFGYTDALARVILVASGKIERVHTISYWPLMSGRGFALKLHRAGVASMSWPDSAASQAVSRSDYVIIPVLGVSADNIFVSEAGAYMLSLLAEDEDKELVLIGRTWNFRPSTPRGISDIEVEAEHPIRKKLTLKVRVFDIVPLHKARVLITEAGEISRLEPEEVKKVYTSLLKEFTSILT